MTNLIADFEQALLMLDRLGAEKISSEAGRTLSPSEFVEEVVVPAMERVGAGWENGTVALSQVYMSGRICEDVVDAILPPGAPERITQPKMAIAVFEDQHLLGKRIVYTMLRASGFELLDYGHVDLDGLVRRVEADGIRILLLSTLMLSSALRINAVRARLSRDIKIVVGGAPFRFDARLGQEVGADAVGLNAPHAVRIITKMVEELS